MTQTPTKKPETPWQVTFPKDDTQTDHSRRSLVAACYGHEGVARVLDRFVYLASWKVKNERLESCKDVQLSLTHKDILDSLQKSNNYNITRKTLIKYLDRLHEWKYVTCPRYGRSYIVHFEPVQAAIDQPPEPTPKARRPKCCKVVRKSEEDNATTLQLSSEITVQHYTDLLKEREELAQKVVSLQQNVELLQLKVVSLQQNVGNVTTLQRDLAALEKLVHDHFAETPVITYHLPSLTGKYIGDDAIAHHPLITLTSLLDQEEDEYEHLIVESTLKGITLPSNHIDESPLGSYSQQDATGNALVENGEDHDPTRSRRPRVDDHNLSGNADSLSLPAAAGSSRTTQAQQIALQENDNNSHSHEETHNNGLSDTTPPGLVGAVRSAGDQDADRSGSSQGSGPDTRRLPVANSTASGGVGCGVRGKARAQAEGAATAGAGGSANGCDVGGEVAPHQGQSQTDATSSLSVENSKAVGKGNKATPPSKKAKVELTEDQKHRARATRMMIEDKCGALTENGPIINEKKCIAKLVQRYSDADIHDVHHYLFHCHFKWSKDEYKYTIHGNILLEQMEPILRLFAEKPQLRTAEKPAPSQKPTSAPSGPRYPEAPKPPAGWSATAPMAATGVSPSKFIVSSAGRASVTEFLGV